MFLSRRFSRASTSYSVAARCVQSTPLDVGAVFLVNPFQVDPCIDFADGKHTLTVVAVCGVCNHATVPSPAFPCIRLSIPSVQQNFVDEMMADDKGKVSWLKDLASATNKVELIATVILL